MIGPAHARQRDTSVRRGDDLVSNIRKHGLISPVLARETGDGRYELLAGQRRFRAHEILGRRSIRARILDRRTSEHDARLLSLADHITRKGVGGADLADAVQFFVHEYGSTGATAEKLGLSAATIRRYAGAAMLPKAVRDDVSAKLYTADHALTALQALGGDESTVDVQMLRETAKEMENLSPQVGRKLAAVRRREPGLPPGAAAEKARRMTGIGRISLPVTNEQLERVGEYKKRRGMADDADAVAELLDLGLESTCGRSGAAA